MEFNIADLYEAIADQIGDKTAVVSGDHRLTYGELDARANRLAHYFAAQGVGAGDHVGLHLYNGHEFVEAMLALYKLRAVPININYRYVAEELLYLFDNADLKGLVFQGELADVVAEVAPRVPALGVYLAVEGAGQAALEGLGAVHYEAAMEAGSPDRDFEARSGDDIYIIYTGGTTGMPRGVMWRHEDVFFAGLQGGRPGGDPIDTADELAPLAASGDVALNILPTAPFIHGAAQWACWISLFSGGTLVIVPGRSYRPDVVWQQVAAEEVDSVLIVGDAMARPLADELAKVQGDTDTSSLMVIASGGAVLSDSVKEQLMEMLPNTMILNNFGSTETGHQGTAYPGADVGKSGRTCFYMNDTNTVVDDDGVPVEAGSGKIGMLARRGRLPIGYYNDPEKTATTFVTIDGERWAIPGDYALIEEDGMITVLGRGSVCINTGGEKVFPEEVEEALKAHPAVFDAVVIGIPDPQWGSRVAALIEVRPDTSPSLQDLDAHARAKVAGYKAPRFYHFVDTMTRHPSGKPDYRWAKETATAAAEAAAS